MEACKRDPPPSWLPDRGLTEVICVPVVEHVRCMASIDVLWKPLCSPTYQLLALRTKVV